MTPASPNHPVHAYLKSLQKELSRGDATRKLMQDIDAVANGQLWPEASSSL